MDMPAGQVELRILLLEDTPTDAELEEEALREAGLSFTAKRVDTREAFIRALEEFKPDIILADYKLPAFDGAAAVEIVRQQHPDVPVVMVTGAMGDERAVELLGLGAKDYILKDRLARLGPAVRRALSAEQGIRARKAAEKALRESEEQFRSVFENAKDVILAMTTDGTLIMLNPAFEQITGWSCAEWIGKPFPPLVHPDDLPNAMHLLERAARGETLPVFEVRILKKAGGHVVGEITIAPLVRHGKKAYLFGIARDITERKQMHEALEEAADRQRTIMQTANDAIICMRPDGAIHLWNHKAEELFGYTAGEAIGQTLHQLIVPEHYHEKVAEGLQQFVKTGTGPIVGRTLELSALHKDGTEFPIELSVSAMNIRGEWHATGIIRDITERKQAEEALRLHSEMLKNLSEGIFLIRASDGVIVFANPQFERMFGYEPGELPGKHVSIVNAPDGKGPEAIADAIIGELAQTGKWSGEIQNIRKDGTTFWCYASTSAFDHPQYGNVWVSVHEDITERKLAEARIQKLSRLYATLSQTNEIIVRATDRRELLCSVCKGVITHGKFILAWWGMVDEATHLVEPVCVHGAGKDYLANIVTRADDVPEGRGPAGTAIRENRVCYVNNFASGELTPAQREAALEYGIRGAAGVPLRFKGKAIGALTLYTEDPDFFDAEQLGLLEEMAADISFALDGFEREALRRQAEGEREAALQKLRKSLEDSIRMAASISEVRDPYTAGHQQRVSQLAAAIASEMGLSAAQIEGIRFGSLIHDIGKIGVPAEILSKPSQLTLLEMELIRTHPKAGYETVTNIEFTWPVAQMILQHHERLDGSGYPAGLKDGEIILEARIIAVADTVEAMSSHRPYRPGRGLDAALAEISGSSGVRYDKQAVEACLRLIREKGFTFKPD